MKEETSDTDWEEYGRWVDSLPIEFDEGVSVESGNTEMSCAIYSTERRLSEQRG